MSTAAPFPDASTVAAEALPSPEQLPDDPALLKQMILELLAMLRQERSDKESLRHRLDYLLRRLYGPRGERFDPNQPLLFGEAAANAASAALGGADATAAASDEAQTQTKKKPKPAPHGRRQLPDNLRRVPCEHELSEAERLCAACGTQRIDIGVTISEQLEYEPSSLYVIEHRQHKYLCPCCGAAAADSAAGLAAPTADADAPASTDATGDATLSTAPDAATAAAAPSVESTTATAAAASASSASAVPVVLQPPVALSNIILVAPKPSQPIAKGLPGPGLLAYLLVSKYVDHLPLHRQERITQRHGLLLSRSTTCDWLASCADLLRPLYEQMIAVVLRSRVLHTDDTTVKILDPPPGATDQGRLWVYLGDPAHPYNVFDFTPNRERVGPQTFLARFRGYLQADAYTGYDGLYLPRDDGAPCVFEVACNAHARRKFHDARKTDLARAHLALAYYGQLYEIERRAKEQNFDETMRLRLRQDLAVPILAQMEQWLRQQKDQVLPKSPIGEAIGYALNHWTALVRYTQHGFLAIDNNVAEREMKRVAIGRKNWLHVGSPTAGHTAAIHYSFTSTCQRLGIEPWTYLRDILARLPTTPAAALPDLLPDRWQAARHAASQSPATPD